MQASDGDRPRTARGVLRPVPADQSTRALLGELAHELRSPLAAARNAAHLLAAGASDRDLVARAQEMIERQTESIAHLLDDALDLAALSEPHPLHDEVLDLVPVARRAAAATEA